MSVNRIYSRGLISVAYFDVTSFGIKVLQIHIISLESVISDKGDIV